MHLQDAGGTENALIFARGIVCMKGTKLRRLCNIMEGTYIYPLPIPLLQVKRILGVVPISWTAHAFPNSLHLGPYGLRRRVFELRSK